MCALISKWNIVIFISLHFFNIWDVGGSQCTSGDFQCKNGRCILNSWHCDGRNDCADNSDEEDCLTAGVSACARDQVSCPNGECIATLWRCDGEPDCPDASDEMNCNETRCDSNQLRCDNGQCMPRSWLCDGSVDCHDGSDEKNCSVKVCNEFLCEKDGSCIAKLLKCDGRKDCNDGSDEKNCPDSHMSCNQGMYQCSDGTCIYDYEVCDGHNDCSNNLDESNCTTTACTSAELLCVSSMRCILRKWICDGDSDCPDGSDEKDCKGQRSQAPVGSVHPTSRTIASKCDEFLCRPTGQCLPWAKVCDGMQDCVDLSDEGGLCSRSCSNDNGGCSQICKKSPQGPQCLCLTGYKLLPDKKTCDDIDECLDPATCSHFCNNTKGGFKCSCAEGYYLHHDHKLCRADGSPATLMYLLGDQIRGLNLVSHELKIYLNISIADMRGMDYDVSEGIFYWTEWNDGSINSYSPDTDRQNILVRFDVKPLQVRYDWIEKNLFYVDSSSNIGVCSNDGRFCKILMHSMRDISSIDISPTTGQIFWTVLGSQLDQYSSLIERAEMDGSHKLVIVSEKSISPTSITVDHVLKLIYWIDMKLNTIECADFYGLKRRQIVQYGMHFPFAMAVFENYVYWSDWGSDSLSRCEKFTGECSVIHKGNAKARTLLVVQKVMQPKGINRCLNNNCEQLCVPTRTSYTCMCGEEFDERNGTCELKSTAAPNLPTECPKHYCFDDIECVVEGGQFVCLCPPQFSGKLCEIKVHTARKAYDYSWIVFVFLSILILGIIILLVLLCPKSRKKLERMREKVSVKFQDPKSCRDGRLMIEVDGKSCYN